MQRDNADYFSDNKYIKELVPSDFDKSKPWKLLPLPGRKDKTCGMVLFYAPWCPHCKNVAPIWNESASITGFCDWFALNCEKHKAHVLKIKESMPNLIDGYPTMVYYKDGEPLSTMTDRPTTENLLNMCANNCKHEG